MGRPLAAVLTLGCKLNLADSGEIAAGLRRAGYDVVDHVCEADAYVINTCSVTHVADAKSRKLIRSMRRLAPAARVAVTGCYPQSAGFDAVRDLGADFVAGTRDADKAALVAFLAADAPPPAPAAPAFEPAPLVPGLTRAFVKAQEGCNDVCAFCIVPRTRGREESRAIDAVAAEVQRAVDAGAREVVITGTQLGAWGRDLDPPLRPHHLISGVLERTEVLRLRFSSLQPQDITPELLALWQDPRLMPHFHLALQSGSETILAAMRRRYTARDFLLAAERIRAAVPAAAITTDVIAGFPGETGADFEATLALCREVGFARIHAFPYSQRSRTAAARMPGQLPPEVKKERMARLLALGEELSLAFRRVHRGTTRPVLWEEEKSGEWFGHTDNYIPVYAPGANLRNRVTPVELGEVYHDGVRGTLPTEAP
ncbi:MiaB/RimO family radical SAM methylthiotransferase [Tepidiforma sp.]|uniref:MiaB/RimO family radical SAM methylthiotransferase n=1 Tax=Tepidiforma sp. TaxID=2682230 RepID=UPI0021DBB42D|nr:MiaB/RimO family radical SAM methylthiotransferase [Tepidiforma sp.]MCX7616936.1 MiaB/RimO family radical SAM methylthiotransferase [Tepidiforma sp.]GIW18846.1 MAG: tRNA (N(6)-L-threonylcarbamoyladenosine(37)-C(2))-methylthiotransferase MtaB [Tepidiforma sp.]